MYKRFISILCMFLIVCLPLVVAQELKEGVGEDIVPSVSEFGEAETTDIIINVNKYEPVVIVSSVLEERNIPVYAFLSGIPTAGLTLPRIQSISASVIGGDKKRIVGGIQYIKPNFYTWDDLGHLSLKLRKIEKEADIPDSIDVEVSAKIKYEAEVTSHLIGGKETKPLKEEPGLEVEEILTNSNYVFFGGKGRIHAERISGNTASFVLYNSEGERVSRFSVREGRESPSYRLVKGSNLPEDFVRVRVDKIIDKTQNFAVIDVDGIDHAVNVGDEILDWRIADIGKDYVKLRSGKEIRTVKLKESFGDFLVKEITEGEKPVAIFDFGEVNKDDDVGANCMIKDITPNKVYIKHKRTGDVHVLYLMTEIERERYYTYPSSRYTDTLEGEICGEPLLLRNIDTKKLVNIALLSGKKTGYSETTFWLHLPIEKRPFELSPRALDKKINKTTKMIKDLDKNIIKLERIVKRWREICLYTTAAMLAINLVKGLFGVGKLAQEEKIKKVAEKTAEKTTEELAEETAKKLWDSVTKGKSDCPNSPGYEKLEGYKFYGGQDVYVYSGIPNVYYICENGKISDAIKSPIIKNKDGKDVVWDSAKGFTVYTGVEGTEFNNIRIATVRDKKATIIPLKNPASLKWIGQQYKQWQINPKTAGKRIYVVAFDNEIEFWVINGNVLDAGDTNLANKNDNRLVDYYLTSASKTGDRRDREIFKEFEVKYLSRIFDAQRRGEFVVELDERNYQIDNTGQKFGELGEETCESVLGKTQCWFIYNACDPVICPPSRCDLGGKARDSKGNPTVKNVVQSGFVGSTILCLPNIKQGVIVPFCISGWLAAYKNYRSILKAYVACLTNSKIKGISTGICDKMTSIYYCQIIWQEIMSIFNLDRGLLGLFVGETMDSVGKGGVKGIPGAVSETTKGLNYFVNEYATNMFAAYRGRSTAQIGVEFCKSYTAGKLPNIGDFIEEISEPEDPVQYTAWFEEHPYAPTIGQSLYKVWYHIYAGNPKREQRVRYKIYLKTLGKPFLQIAEGELKEGEYADETIDKPGLIGYQQICIVINGVENCNFGKIISTSYMIDDVHGKWMRKFGGLAPNITMKEQCISTQEGLTPSIVPMAAVERKCGVTNPSAGLGKIEEQQWIKVGKCTDQEYCWQKMDLRQNSELREVTSETICKNQGGVWCPNQKCSIKMDIFKYDDNTGHYECCLAGGVCVDIMPPKLTQERLGPEPEEEKPAEEEPAEEEVKKEETHEEIIKKFEQASNCEAAEDLLDEYKFENLWEESDAFYWIGFKCFDEKNYNKAEDYLKKVVGTYVLDAWFYLGKTWLYLGDTETNVNNKIKYYKDALYNFDKLSDKESTYYNVKYEEEALKLKKETEEKLS